MAIVGIGTDIVAIDRIMAILQRTDDRLAQRILSQSEWQEYQQIKDIKPQTHFLAKRFAVKEAAAKALGMGMRSGVAFHQFTVTHNGLGKPYLLLSGAAQACAEKLAVTQIHISITDEKHYACAMVVMEKE